MIRRPPRSTQGVSSAASDVYKRQGRWALDPSLSSLKDDTFDVDNDTLANGMEAPDRWDTNPVDDDTDGDLLPDGWEVYYSQLAFENGLADNETVGVYGARGVMDPSMPDSDLDGIDDGFERTQTTMVSTARVS